MGLDVSHDCWHGPYSAFHRWRKAVCEVAGYGDLDHRVGFGGTIAWPDSTTDPLVILLNHSDCDGSIPHQHAGAIAARLEELLPALFRYGRYPDDHHRKAQQWIDGLYEAKRLRQKVLFR